MNELEKKDNRNYGIDLLRIVSMFFVILLHCYGQGGLLFNEKLSGSNYNFVWFMEIFAYCAVDVFAIISGYVSYRKNKEIKNNRLSKYLNLWFEIVFYGLILTFIFNIIGVGVVTKTTYLRSFFPVSLNLYWYFTAYSALYLIMPIIDKGIDNLDNKYLYKLFFLLIVVYSVFEIFTDKFIFNLGYSFIWLTILYMIGAIMKKLDIGKKINSINAFILIVILSLFTFFVLKSNINIKIDTLGIDLKSDFLVNYTSPTILIISILYVIGFSKIKVNNTLKNIIKFAAPSAFSIYVLNNYSIMWDYVMKDLFAYLVDSKVFIIALLTIGFSLGFSIISIFIDKIRIFIFKLLKIDILCEKIDKLYNNIFNKIIGE